MCKFCDALKQEKKIKWEMRSTYADDNSCEAINGVSCSECNGCKMNFYLDSYVVDGNVFVSTEYEQVVGRYKDDPVVIRPFSESIQFNYCPICGNKISDKEWDWFDTYIKVEDK